MANMIRNAVGDTVDLKFAEHGAVATRLLSFDTGIVEQLPDFDALEQEYGVEIYHHMKVGQKVNEYHTNLDGCGYIVARAARIEDAISNAETVLSIVRKSVF